ncbi:MAG TPA: hypothetical protein VI977_00370 [archaeon]|nr:hypothetical protein [archaeon]
MIVSWSLHAKHMFAERAAKFGINYAEIELAIKKQEIKISLERNKFKTIFDIQGVLLTAVKIENPKFIHVLTLWESNETEAEKWKKK